MSEAEIAAIAAEFIAADWEPDRYYRDLDLVAFVAAIEARAKASAWQPIETAPKDGTRVILFDAQREPKEMIARWKADAWWGDPTPSGKSTVWRDDTGAHWQPIPPPPEAA